MARDDLIRATARALGFKRTGAKIKNAVASVLDTVTTASRRFVAKQSHRK